MQATDRRKLPQSDEVTLAEVNSELGMRLLSCSWTGRVLVFELAWKEFVHSFDVVPH
jgi:hypothetical protein